MIIVHFYDNDHQSCFWDRWLPVPSSQQQHYCRTAVVNVGTIITRSAAAGRSSSSTKLVRAWMDLLSSVRSVTE